MKAINIKLATFSFAAMLLASCSDSGTSGEDSIIDPVGKATTIVGSNVTAEYADQLASRVRNYKGAYATTTTKTRALATRAETTEPTVPAGTPNLSSIEKEKWNSHSGKTYVVPAGETLKADGYNIEGMTIYVKGTLEYSSAYGSGASINVLSGGKLIARNSNEVFSDTKVSNWGKVEFPANQKEYLIKNTFYQYAGDLNVKGHDLNIQGGKTSLFFVKNSLIADNVTMSGDAQLYVTDNATLTGKFEMSNQSQAWVNNIMTTTSVKIQNTTMLHSGCALKVDGDVYATNGTNLYIMFLKAKYYKQDSGAILHLQDQSMVDIEGKYVNLNQNQGYADLPDKDGVAVIKADAFYYNAPGKQGDWNPGGAKTVDCSIFSTSGDNAHIILDTNVIYGSEGATTPITDENTTIVWNNNANILFKDDSEAKNYVIKKTECNPNGYNADKEPTEEPTKEPTLDLISSIDYNHDHDISATCIQSHNGRLYMSYHTRDKKHGGCIEVFSPIQNNKVTLEQYLCDDQKDLDFNHLLAVKLNSGKRMVYLPGSSNKKGAMLAYLPIQDNNLLADQSKSITTTIDGKDTVIYEKPLQFIQMNPATAEYKKKGYDENCVVYNDETNHLIVATTKGYLVYNADTYNELDKINKPGKVKHIAIGNGKIVTVYLNREATNETEAIPATVEIFDQKAEDLSNPINSFAISTIEPNNGKNVVRVDDNKIYVCRGAAGMYVYDMEGNELWHYQMPSPTITEGDKAGKYKGHANGCYVGKKYVYIAYGGFGLVVLDKETHKVVAHRDLVHSANYVIEYKGYIYVAYGQNRLQVFQLKNADPEISY
ncbi:hypothetical protein ACQRAV_04315 [Segatella copri]|uniref:hypothetical protein n=1 Tax=Segatella copri TaxID=165179 RepID=UPI003D013A21